ncbi:MAG: DUF3137 domain-containing protein [Candidatus Omnitrophica bacterium]|nr:DUF3137 domain-containing protein [Candidatus Omnitrophota bacterium]
MKTLEELKNFYESTLLPELKVLEIQRLKVRNKVLLGGFTIIPLAALLAFFVKNKDLAMLIMLLGIIAVFFISFIAAKDYRKNFKKGIIESIVHFIDKNLSYQRTGCIARSSFMDSKIFTRRPDEYSGDDYVKGKVGQTHLEFSEIHAKYVTYDSKGRRQVHTIFKGLFFIADFNKHFSGRTVVLPDTAEKLFGQIGTLLQSINKIRGQLIKLEDPEFEKIFAVYGDNQIEARYILSTSLMSRMVEFKKKTRRRICFSFIGSKVYVAVSYGRNLFEPRIFRTLLDFSPIGQYFEDFQMAVGIVEDLNLNTRIWTKT